MSTHVLRSPMAVHCAQHVPVGTRTSGLHSVVVGTHCDAQNYRLSAKYWFQKSGKHGTPVSNGTDPVV